jgi:RNA polymerase sigma factor for flagellar operon FliA
MNAIAAYVSVQSVQADDVETLVREHTALVKRIAYHLLSRLPPSVQVDDLIQAGLEGLIEAVRHYDACQGASFETYAGIRIRGAMLDELRRYDWTPRSVHRKAREAAEAIHIIETRTGRDARDAEVAEYLQISLSEYHQVLQDAVSCRLFSMEELLESGDGVLEECADERAAPEERLIRAGFTEALADAISSLPERERLVVSLYYEEEMNLREIGAVLGVSESRICQIQSQAMLRLRARMHDWVEVGEGKPRGKRPKRGVHP